jgi:hypothetical protein
MVASAPRACIQLGANAAAEILEDFGPALGGSASFTNSVMEVRPPPAGLVAPCCVDMTVWCPSTMHWHPWHPVHSVSSGHCR